MTLDSLFAKLNYYSGKDKRGKTFKITEFNALLPTVQDALYNSELNIVTAGNVTRIPESRLSITPLRVFQKSTSPSSIEDGVLSLPADYRRYISVSGNYKEIEVVAQNTFNDRRTSVFRRPEERPFCYIAATDIVFCPNALSSVELQYFRTPTTPYYDYCQDASTLNEIYMPVGSVVKADEPGVYGLYDSSNNLIRMSVTHSSNSYPHTSTSVELEWEEIYHDKFVLAMLAMVGINIQMNDLTQYAEAKGNA